MEKRKKIAAKDFNGVRVMANEAETARLVCGVVFGIATGVASTEAVDGSTLYGLRGSFQYDPAKDGDKEPVTLRAPVLYLPGNLDADVRAKVEGDNAAEVQFAYEVAAVKSGKTWTFELAPLLPLTEVPDADPLARVKTAIDKAAKTK